MVMIWNKKRPMSHVTGLFDKFGPGKLVKPWHCHLWDHCKSFRSHDLVLEGIDSQRKETHTMMHLNCFLSKMHKITSILGTNTWSDPLPDNYTVIWKNKSIQSPQHGYIDWCSKAKYQVRSSAFVHQPCVELGKKCDESMGWNCIIDSWTMIDKFIMIPKNCFYYTVPFHIRVHWWFCQNNCKEKEQGPITGSDPHCRDELELANFAHLDLACMHCHIATILIRPYGLLTQYNWLKIRWKPINHSQMTEFDT